MVFLEVACCAACRLFVFGINVAYIMVLLTCDDSVCHRITTKGGLQGSHSLTLEHFVCCIGDKLSFSVRKTTTSLDKATISN